MRVLFVNPLVWRGWGLHEHLLRDWLAGESVTSVVHPPLELAYAAAVVRAHGHEVGLLDASALHLRHPEVVSEAERFRPGMVVIPSTRFSSNDDRILIGKIRAALPDAKIAVSGQNVSEQPEAFVRTGLVDYAIHHEIEIGLVAALRDGQGPNVASRTEDGTISVGPKRQTEDLDSLPFPARDLLPNERYRTHYVKRNPFTMVLTSRGCPYRCRFCEIPRNGLGKYRTRSTGNVLDELSTLRQFGIREVMFRDGTFTLERERTLDLCNGMTAGGLDLTWKCMTTVDRVDAEVLEAMHRAGCHLVSFGFETASQGLLDRTGKGTTVEEGRVAARLARESGLETIGFFILGLDGETQETAARTIEFSKSLDLDYAQFILYFPLDDEEGRTSEMVGDPFDAEEAVPRAYRRVTEHSDQSLSADDLRRIIRRAYREFYTRPALWWKSLRKVRRLGDLSRLGSGAIALIWYTLSRDLLARRTTFFLRTSAQGAGGPSAQGSTTVVEGFQQ